MIIFNTDLDNTIIFSYKHDIGENKICAEIYHEREISFITNKTAELLKKVNESTVFVPTTTRTLEQYNRIDLGLGTPKYALVCNGGVLLVDGQEDQAWFEESCELVAACTGELEKASELLEKDENRSLDVRNIRGLFIFTKSEKPLETAQMLNNELNTAKVDVFTNGVKVYVLPKKLTKGEAVMRLKKRLGAELVISAGDSEFDISMLSCSDLAILPQELAEMYSFGDNTAVHKGEEVFSEFVLQTVLDKCAWAKAE